MTAIALAAAIAAAVAVTPSFAESFLTGQQAARTYLKKQTAGNLYVKKATAPITPTASIAASNTVFGPVSATTAGYIPTAFTSFATKGIGPAVISFSGQATCTAAKPTAELACPINILVDGQSAAKVNFAPATASSPAPAADVYTAVQTTVLSKGGHTVAIQYAGAKNVTFTLKSWNLAVQAYPQPAETGGQ
ncbi:MAG: hypothetical protein WB507_02445 [Solirubrobacterales bacterium]